MNEGDIRDQQLAAERAARMAAEKRALQVEAKHLEEFRIFFLTPPEEMEPPTPAPPIAEEYYFQLQGISVAEHREWVTNLRNMIEAARCEILALETIGIKPLKAHSNLLAELYRAQDRLRDLVEPTLNTVEGYFIDLIEAGEEVPSYVIRSLWEEDEFKEQWPDLEW